MAIFTGIIDTPYVRTPGWAVSYATRWGTSARMRGSRSGQYPARWQKVVNRRAALAARWRGTLTGAQRTAWGTYATSAPVPKESGRSIHLNGYQWFCRINLTALNIGRPLQDAPPTTSLITYPHVAGFSYPTPATIAVTFASTDAWRFDPKAFLIVMERGWTTVINRRRKVSCRIAGTQQGIPVIGAPNPVVLARPYPTTVPGGATILTRIFYDQ